MNVNSDRSGRAVAQSTILTLGSGIFLIGAVTFSWGQGIIWVFNPKGLPA